MSNSIEHFEIRFEEDRGQFDHFEKQFCLESRLIHSGIGRAARFSVIKFHDEFYALEQVKAFEPSQFETNPDLG